MNDINNKEENSSVLGKVFVNDLHITLKIIQIVCLHKIKVI